MLLALTQWASYLVVTNRARAGRGVVEFMSAVTPIGLATSAPIALVVAGGDALWPLPARSWVAVGLLTVITGVGAHGFIVFARRHVPAATIGIMQVAQTGAGDRLERAAARRARARPPATGHGARDRWVGDVQWTTQRRIVSATDAGAPPVEV